MRNTKKNKGAFLLKAHKEADEMKEMPWTKIREDNSKLTKT